MALVDALRTFMYVSLWGKPVISVARGLGGLIKSIFRSGEQGFAYDINDLSTLFQDAAGTTPVTAAGQPVGLVLDKSKGLVLGPELISGGNFEAGLIGSKLDGSGSVSSWELNTISPISGTQDGKLIITTPAGGRPSLSFSSNAKVVGELYELSFDYKVTSGLVNILGVYNGASTLTIGSNLSSFGKFKTRYIALGNNNVDIIYFGNSAGTMQIDNLSVKRVLGNHAYQTTSASRPLLQRNATTGAYYLAFDGVDDFLVTSSIDFTATDKVSVFAGVRTIGVTRGIVVHNGSSTPQPGVDGSFTLEAPSFQNNTYCATMSKTNSNADAISSTFVAPSSDVLSAFYDGNAPNPQSVTKLRRNTVMTTSSGLDTVNQQVISNAPIYIGRRGGVTLPFNGHLYSLVGIGRLTSDSETIALEKSIAKNVGVAL